VRRVPELKLIPAMAAAAVVDGRGDGKDGAEGNGSKVAAVVVARRKKRRGWRKEIHGGDAGG